MSESIDLYRLFQTVAERLSEQKETLNEIDDYNHDHGDHMVQTFDLIQKAVGEKAGKPPAEQLAYASKVVDQEAHNGSAKLYAQGLSKAADNFSNTELNENTLGDLVKSLLMSKEPAQSQGASESGNLLGGLLSGLTGKADNNKDTDQQLGVDDIFRVGMAFYQSKQDGESNTDAIMDALLAASPMSKSAHRTKSGSLVASTIMDFAGSFLK